jgi:hypothetical protein
MVEAAPHGQQTPSEDRSVADRLERMQRQRRALGEAIHSASSRSPLNARSKETAAFFVETAATINSMRRSVSEEFAIFDKDFVKQVSVNPVGMTRRLSMKHELLMDHDDEKSPPPSSPGGSSRRSSSASSAASPDGRGESADIAGRAILLRRSKTV